MSRVEDIARKKLETDQRLQYMPPDAVHRDLQQELDRSAHGRVISYDTLVLQLSVLKVPDC
jgi:hypothetical protein